MVPGRDSIFDAYVNEKPIFSRHREGRFPEISKIINLVKAEMVSVDD